MHYLVGLLEFPVRICDALQSQHTRDAPNLSYDCHLITAFIGFFCSRVYMYVYGMLNITKYMSALRVLNQEFWKISGYFFFNMCLIDL